MLPFLKSSWHTQLSMILYKSRKEVKEMVDLKEIATYSESIIKLITAIILLKVATKKGD